MLKVFWAVFILAIAGIIGPAKLMGGVYLMAQTAELALKHDQLSYSKFTKTMLNAKPRKPGQR